MANNYPAHGDYYCIDAYKPVEKPEEWDNCPRCKLKPKVWVFDNGEHTACGCWESKYDHFDVTVENTIGKNVRDTGGFLGYDPDTHRQNWNSYCRSYEVAHA